MKIKKNVGILLPLILLLLSMLPMVDLAHPGLPVTHDGKDHVARIANFYQNLAEGTNVPRWAANLNWGYGHPILMFLYPLPSYIASLFHFLGLSFVDSTKIVLAIGYIGSGLAMYLWLQAFLPKYAAFFGGLLYMFAPYRFVDIYVRGDVGENFAFIFTPLVLYCLLKLYKSTRSTLVKPFGPELMVEGQPDSLRSVPSLLKREKKYIPPFMKGGRGDLQRRLPQGYTLLGALALAGLILAHNAVALMFLPMILFYATFLFFANKNTKYFILNTLYILVLGFALAAFFWIPGLLEGKFTLRNIVTAGEYADRFVSFSSLIYGPWNYGQTGQFTQQLGIIQWLAVLSAPIAFFKFNKEKSKQAIFIMGLVMYMLCAIFLMLPQSKLLWQHIMLLQNFQFPWRFLAITVFVTSVLGAISLSILSKKLLFFVMLLLSIAVVSTSYNEWQANGYFYMPETYYTGIYAGTTDTGESAPIWSVRFMEHIPPSHTEVIQGKAQIVEQKRTSIQHVYSVSVINSATLRDNTVYFPGWEAFVDGKSVSIQYQDPNNRGVITFPLPAGKHRVSLLFTETKLRLISDYFSLLALLFVTLCVVFVRKKTN